MVLDKYKFFKITFNDETFAWLKYMPSQEWCKGGNVLAIKIGDEWRQFAFVNTRGKIEKVKVWKRFDSQEIFDLGSVFEAIIFQIDCELKGNVKAFQGANNEEVVESSTIHIPLTTEEGTGRAYARKQPLKVQEGTCVTRLYEPLQVSEEARRTAAKAREEEIFGPDNGKTLQDYAKHYPWLNEYIATIL